MCPRNQCFSERFMESYMEIEMWFSPFINVHLLIQFIFKFRLLPLIQMPPLHFSQFNSAAVLGRQNVFSTLSLSSSIKYIANLEAIMGCVLFHFCIAPSFFFTVQSPISMLFIYKPAIMLTFLLLIFIIL